MPPFCSFRVEKQPTSASLPILCRSAENGSHALLQRMGKWSKLTIESALDGQGVERRIIMGVFRFGIMGAAKIGAKFCDAVSRLPQAQVAAVASKSQERADAFAKANGVPSAYGDYRRMLERPDIDGVYIDTTNNFHYENMLLCLEYGKPFLCEKAFTITKGQAQEVFSRAEEKGLFTMEAMWSRFTPAVQKAKAWIDGGRIGQIDLASYNFCFVSGSDAAHRLNAPELGGGANRDIGVYAFEILSYLINQPLLEAKTMVNRFSYGSDCTDGMLLRFEHAIATTQVSFRAIAPETAWFCGDRGSIQLLGGHKGGGAVLYGPDRQEIERFIPPEENGFVYEIEEFIRGVREGRLESDVIPHRDTLLCMELFDLCDRENPQEK